MRLNLQTDDDNTRKNTLLYLICLTEKLAKSDKIAYNLESDKDSTISQRLITSIGDKFFQFLSEIVSEVASF
jgi:hypothetical protein